MMRLLELVDSIFSDRKNPGYLIVMPGVLLSAQNGVITYTDSQWAIHISDGSYPHIGHSDSYHGAILAAIADRLNLSATVTEKSS